jgi:hypothetical protein
MLFLFFLACDKGDDSVALETPTISFLEPADKAKVAVGDVQLSIVVDYFTLHDPAKHNEGQPEGYIELTWSNGTASDTLDTGSTTPTINIPSAGTWTITGALYYADGDEITEQFADYVPAEVTVTAK